MSSQKANCGLRLEPAASALLDVHARETGISRARAASELLTAAIWETMDPATRPGTRDYHQSQTKEPAPA